MTTSPRPLHRPARSRDVRLLALCAATTVAVGALTTVAGSSKAHASDNGTAAALAALGAPVQTGTAGPDSATSFNATLPDGRRVTPAGTSVEVGEQPLNGVLTPDGAYLVVTNNDERNKGSRSTSYSQDGVNGAGKTPGGFSVSVIRTSDMSVVSTGVPPVNATPHPGPKVPGVTQSDKTSGLFLGLAVKPTGTPGSYTVYAAGGYSDVVATFPLVGGTLGTPGQISIPVPTDATQPNYGMATPGGLTLSPDGSKLYVVNNSAENVVTVDTASNTVVGTPVPVGHFPYAATVSPDGRTLYVTNWGVSARHFSTTYNNSFAASGVGAGTRFLGGGTTDNAFRAARTDAGSSSLSEVPLAGGSATTLPLGQPIDGTHVVGGTHPSAMALASNTTDNGPQHALYVADANEDALAIVNTDTGALVGKHPLAGDMQGTPTSLGLYPNALVESPDNRRLYVAAAGLNAVAVYDTSTPFSPRLLGLLPTGWYPTALTISSDGGSLYVVNAKGFGSPFGFAGQTSASTPDVNLQFGTVQKIDLTNANLQSGAQQVLGNTVRSLGDQSNNPVVQLADQQAIKHVIYVLRENKTYDSYFGADAVLNGRGAAGSPAFAAWNAQVPQTKALAEQFAVGDNAYADSEESNAGHSYALAGTSTDFQQKTLLERFAKPFLNTKNEDPEDYPLTGYIFDNLARQGLSYRDYGDNLRVSGYDDAKNPNACADDPTNNTCSGATTPAYTDTASPTSGLGGLFSTDVPSLNSLAGHADPNYPGWNLRISDQRRVAEFTKQYDAMTGQEPAMSFVWLPNDHTGGGVPPAYSVADNDAALGQLVNHVSHSPDWASTAIFVTEDDAQGSADHISAHRSYTMVISPYARHGLVSHRLSSTVSVVKTIEELLGLPPMNFKDAVASDLSDYFTTTPDLTPFGAGTASTVAASAEDPEVARISDLSAQLDDTTYDQDNGRLGELDRLYLASRSLDAQKSTMDPTTYGQQQDALYAQAQSVVAGG